MATLHHDTWGEGPPIILLHGLFGSSGNWGTIARQLSSDYQVWALDLRNHGRSPHEAEMSYHQMAQDIHEFVSQQQLSNITLLGHSMGGKVAMVAALEQPDIFQKLIIADIAPVTYGPRFGSILKGFQELDLSQMTTRQAINEAFAVYVSDPMVRQFLLKNVARDGDRFYWRVNVDALVSSMPELLEFPKGLGTYEEKTLFITGGKSDYVSSEDHPTILQHFPKARFVTLKQAGHWLHMEQQELFLQTIRHFVEK